MVGLVCSQETSKPNIILIYTDDLAETKNLVKEHSEKAEELLHKFKSVIAEGRSTEGPTQSNDTGHWEQLESWFTEIEYNKLAQ